MLISRSGLATFFGASLMSTTFAFFTLAGFATFAVFSAGDLVFSLGGLGGLLELGSAHCRRSSMSFTAPTVTSTLS